MYHKRRIRDPLHNLIDFEATQFDDAMWQVTQTRPFQRLRRIKQLGLSELVYPGATHSRFAHSLGVFHTARMLMNIIERRLTHASFQPNSAQRALAAAVLHDVGHGPFSHAFENVATRMELLAADHEHVSDRLIRSGEIGEILDKHLGTGFSQGAADVIKNGPTDIYGAVVSSQFDADRLDYMRRDPLMTGTQHGAIDFEWLIANLEIGTLPRGVDAQQLGTSETFLLGPKAIYAAETYVLGLFQLYPTVYFHKTTRGAEKLLEELLFRLFTLVRDGKYGKTGLPAKHPLVAFAKKPDDLELFVEVDDTTVWGSLSLLARAKDPAIAELAGRLRDRKLYKCIDIRQILAQKIGSDDQQIEMSCESIVALLNDYLRVPVEIPGILIDHARRAPYKKVQESKGQLNQIRIKVDTGSSIDLISKSKVVAAIAPFRLDRVYVRTAEDRKIVNSILLTEGVTC